MRNSVRHLLTGPPPAAQAAAPQVPLSPEVSTNTSQKLSPAPGEGGLPGPKATESSGAADPAATPSLLSAQPTTSNLASPAPPDAMKASPSAPAGSADIDVRYESSKLPLDVAVVESILAISPSGASSAAAEERIKKIATNLLIVGGTGGIHNIGFAVESRVAPALATRMPVLNGVVGYVPCPREIEPEHLAWKGIAALGKLDSANELWLCREEWEALGMRALRERAFYWN